MTEMDQIIIVLQNRNREVEGQLDSSLRKCQEWKKKAEDCEQEIEVLKNVCVVASPRRTLQKVNNLTTLLEILFLLFLTLDVGTFVFWYCLFWLVTRQSWCT
jgi:hypothetical protein